MILRPEDDSASPRRAGAGRSIRRAGEPAGMRKSPEEEQMTRWIPRLVYAAGAACAWASAAAAVPLGPYVGASYGEASLKANDSSVDLHFHGDTGSWKV